MRAFVVLLALTLPAAAAEPIMGRASVVDGDTLDVRGTRIRLHGIDAPESAQLCQDRAGKDYRCGQAAALALADRIGEATVSCEPRDVDRYGRTVAVCRRGGEDLNGWLVGQGHAVAYRRYSLDYVGQEATAKAARLGIWAGTFDEPSAWRKSKREAGAASRPAEVPADGCAIKGNISRKGERIYHLPGGRDYAKVVISAKTGERMFCTEDEARAAGWRAARS